MLYLFGRLALSDSLAYHENFLDDDDCPQDATHDRGRDLEETADQDACQHFEGSLGGLLTLPR